MRWATVFALVSATPRIAGRGSLPLWITCLRLPCIPGRRTTLGTFLRYQLRLQSSTLPRYLMARRILATGESSQSPREDPETMRKDTSLLYAAAGIFAGFATAGVALRLGRRSITPIEVVVITGGSRGLGLELAKKFGAAGSKLVLVARDQEELGRARAILLADQAIASVAQVLLLPANVSDSAQVAGVIGSAIDHFGRVDMLINNAGSIQVGAFEDQPDDAFERAMATNFFPAVHATRAVLPHMLARGTGSIVNISSIGGKVPMPHLLPYVASKFALTGFSEGLHAELRQRGITVTTVCPGLMRTGSPVQAQFCGNRDKEYQWFAFGATTPLLAASAEYAAAKIFAAALAGEAELVITPQAWLGARTMGVAPAITQILLSLVNTYLLPKPAGTQTNLLPGRLSRRSSTPRAQKLEARFNQARTSFQS